MKKERKNDVSNNSDSNKNDFLPSSLKTSMHSNKSSKSKNSAKKNPDSDSDSDSRCSDNNELQTTEAEVKQNSEIEFGSKKASEETADSDFRESYSNNDEFGSIKSTFNIEELTSDDEIYTLQCPENYIKQNLCNKKIDFTKPKQYVTQNKDVFLLELLYCEKKFITLAMPNKISGGSLIKMPLKGHIVIQKELETLPDKSESFDNNKGTICNKPKIVFPDDIKVRHPLLGMEWKTHIDLASEAIRKERKSFSKKSKTKTNKSAETKAVEIINFKRENSDSHIIVQKKKKRKFDT